MKIQYLLLTVIAAAAFVIAGCSKNSSVDTSQLTAAFQTAEANAKTDVEAIGTSLKNADYAGAVTQLKALGNKYKLTPAQKQAVSDVIASAQKAIADLAGKAAGDASKAASDMSKTLNK